MSYLKAIGVGAITVLAMSSIHSCVSASEPDPGHSAPAVEATASAAPTSPTSPPRTTTPTPAPTTTTSQPPVRTTQPVTTRTPEPKKTQEPESPWGDVSNIEILKFTWALVDPDDREVIRRGWLSAQALDAETVFLDTFIGSLTTAVPGLTRAEAREFLDWTLEASV